MRALVLLVPALLSLHGQDTIVFDTPHHDFGRIQGDRKVSHRFRATNRAQFPLQIKQVLPSCGCTSSVTGQWFLKPGESTELEIAFDPKGFRGAIHKSVQVSGEVAANPPVPFNQTLTFQAQVVQEIMPSTSTLFFQGLSRNGTGRSVLTLASGDGQPVKVVRNDIPGAPYLSVNVRQSGADAVLEVSFDGKAVPLNRTNGVDILTTQTANPRMPYIRTNIQWDLKARVTATPERVAWVDSASRELTARLALNHAEGRAFRLLKATCTSPLLRVEGITPQAVARHELKVVLAPSQRGGMLNEWITFETDDAEQPEVKVRVSAVLR